MKLLRCSFNNDNLDAYFDPATRIVYAVRTWRKDVFDVCAFDSSRESDDQWAFASLSVDFASEAEALAELDRIAALIEGKAPAQGWVKGPPPENDGQWLLAMVKGGDPVAVVCLAGADLPWSDTAGNDYPASEFTHHLPTPIEAPKES